jgi:hypothetical protein
MTIPREIYQRWFGAALTQENSLPDGNGNELYHGIAPLNAAAGDGSWVIVKGIYSQTTQNGVSVWWGTHYSTLQGYDSAATPVSWSAAIAGSLVFP